MSTLNALKRAPVLNEAGQILTQAGYSVTSSDPAVALVRYVSGSGYYVVGVAAGTATVTATRTLDAAVATLEVQVLAAAPFSISLGAESPA